ncbi:YbaK/EbsC family protein [Streptomyces sp. NPDC059398]|uniref:YbaK/EbsC family protein n=1 Tax=Streptomyces sp. NPDC059398 TaxID=3346820 RepID=UPI003689DF02
MPPEQRLRRAGAAGAGVPGASPAAGTAHDRLMELLAAGRVPHRLLAHPPEGRTDAASLLRGHPLRRAAKTLVVRVALGRKKSRYVLAVVPGDRRVDLGAVADVAGGVRAGFADRATAERLTGCVSGSIMPFSFHPDLTVLADPELLGQDEIWFNAARLDLSVALSPHAYRRLAAPLVAPLTGPDPAVQAA